MLILSIALLTNQSKPRSVLRPPGAPPPLPTPVEPAAATGAPPSAAVWGEACAASAPSGAMCALTSWLACCRTGSGAACTASLEAKQPVVGGCVHTPNAGPPCRGTGPRAFRDTCHPSTRDYQAALGPFNRRRSVGTSVLARGDGQIAKSRTDLPHGAIRGWKAFVVQTAVVLRPQGM